MFDTVHLLIGFVLLYSLLGGYTVEVQVSRGQTAFFHFSLWWRKKGSGELPLAVLCRELPDFGDC